jgi:hypothetical protein
MAGSIRLYLLVLVLAAVHTVSCAKPRKAASSAVVDQLSNEILGLASDCQFTKTCDGASTQG